MSHGVWLSEEGWGAGGLVGKQCRSAPVVCCFSFIQKWNQIVFTSFSFWARDVDEYMTAVAAGLRHAAALTIHLRGEIERVCGVRATDA